MNKWKNTDRQYLLLKSKTYTLCLLYKFQYIFLKCFINLWRSFLFIPHTNRVNSPIEPDKGIDHHIIWNNLFFPNNYNLFSIFSPNSLSEKYLTLYRSANCNNCYLSLIFFYEEETSLQYTLRIGFNIFTILHILCVQMIWIRMSQHLFEN